MSTDLGRLEALCKEATPAPWPIWTPWPDMPEYTCIDPTVGPRAINSHGHWSKANVAFVSAAREAVPALIEEVARLRLALLNAAITLESIVADEVSEGRRNSGPAQQARPEARRVRAALTGSEE